MSKFIPLTQGMTAAVDDIDADLMRFKWHTKFNDRQYYASRDEFRISKGKIIKIRMHQIILQRMIGRLLKPHEYVDHINGDGLDNRRENLRLATKSQNAMNARKRSDNSSGYKGVTYHKQKNRWTAEIRVNKERIYLGCFTTPEDAYSAYCEAAKKHFGEFARLD